MSLDVNFGGLRECQDTIVAESEWMINELDELVVPDEDDFAHVIDARRLAVALKRVGETCLDLDILVVNGVALSQRSAETHDGPDLQGSVRRLLNGLHAAVAPIAGLIDRLKHKSSDARVASILRAGMVSSLQAIDTIATELKPVLDEKDGQAGAGEDFGVYDPVTD